MLYNVSFMRNNVFQSNLVETDKDVTAIDEYFRSIRKVDEVYGITDATTDHVRPDKPVIRL